MKLISWEPVFSGGASSSSDDLAGSESGANGLGVQGWGEEDGVRKIRDGVGKRKNGVGKRRMGWGREEWDGKEKDGMGKRRM